MSCQKKFTYKRSTNRNLNVFPSLYVTILCYLICIQSIFGIQCDMMSLKDKFSCCEIFFILLLLWLFRTNTFKILLCSIYYIWEDTHTRRSRSVLLFSFPSFFAYYYWTLWLSSIFLYFLRFSSHLHVTFFFALNPKFQRSRTAVKAGCVRKLDQLIIKVKMYGCVFGIT